MILLKKTYLNLKTRIPGDFASKWSIAMFAHRESSEVLTQSIKALLMAVKSDSIIDVIVNGNEPLALQMVRLLDNLVLDDQSASVSLRIWHIAQGDKAHAWNQYLYGIWEGAEIAYFVDGYVRVHSLALTRISAALAHDHFALAATGVPSQGSSAARMKAQLLAENGLHGNLHALRGASIMTLIQRKFILPVGIYRTDSLIGAAIKYNLDPTKYGWEPKRIKVVADASWDHTPLAIIKLSDLGIQFKRVIRQGQGVFENLAIRRHLSLDAKSLETLPETASDLARNWMQEYPLELLRTLVKHPLAAFSLQRIMKPKNWSKVSIPPNLLACKKIEKAPISFSG